VSTPNQGARVSLARQLEACSCQGARGVRGSLRELKVHTPVRELQVHACVSTQPGCLRHTCVRELKAHACLGAAGAHALGSLREL